jgi:hypothetical protein
LEDHRFDAITLALSAGSPSRRHLLRGVAGGALGAALARFGLAVEPAAAAKCAGNNKACKRGSQCCSGICRKKKCKLAPQQGTCTIRQDACEQGGIGFGPKCNGVANCECIVTKTGAAFCRQIGEASCIACTNDQDCEVQLAPNAKCIQKRDLCVASPCGPEGGDTFCAAPCGFISG